LNKDILKQTFSISKCESFLFVQFYVDESGTHDEARAILVGGAVAGQRAWLKLETVWRAIFKSYRMPYFHASDFNAGRKPFDHLDSATRATILNQLVGAMNKHIRSYIAVGVYASDLKEVSETFPDTKRSPYEFCLEECLMGASVWAREHEDIQKIAVYCEAGQSHNSEGVAVWNDVCKSEALRKRWKLHELAFVPKEGIIPLQVADLLVYELYRYHVGYAIGRSDELRFAMDKLSSSQKFFGRFHNKRSLESWFMAAMENRDVAKLIWPKKYRKGN